MRAENERLGEHRGVFWDWPGGNSMMFCQPQLHIEQNYSGRPNHNQISAFGTIGMAQGLSNPLMPEAKGIY